MWLEVTALDSVAVVIQCNIIGLARKFIRVFL